LVSSLCIVCAKRNPTYPHVRPKSERERTHPILAPGNVHETNSGLSVPRHGLSIERRREWTRRRVNQQRGWTLAATAATTTASAATTACVTHSGIVDRIEVVDRPGRSGLTLPSVRRLDVGAAAAQPEDRLITGDHGCSGSWTGCGAHRNESDESGSRQIQLDWHCEASIPCSAKPEWVRTGLRRGHLPSGSNELTPTW
jgi:hypothetical protein